jgi:hypothetical protein
MKEISYVTTDASQVRTALAELLEDVSQVMCCEVSVLKNGVR